MSSCLQPVLFDIFRRGASQVTKSTEPESGPGCGFSPAQSLAKKPRRSRARSFANHAHHASLAPPHLHWSNHSMRPLHRKCKRLHARKLPVWLDRLVLRLAHDRLGSVDPDGFEAHGLGAVQAELACTDGVRLGTRVRLRVQRGEEAEATEFGRGHYKYSRLEVGVPLELETPPLRTGGHRGTCSEQQTGPRVARRRARCRSPRGRIGNCASQACTIRLGMVSRRCKRRITIRPGSSFASTVAELAIAMVPKPSKMPLDAVLTVLRGADEIKLPARFQMFPRPSTGSAPSHGLGPRTFDFSKPGAGPG